MNLVYRDFSPLNILYHTTLDKFVFIDFEETVAVNGDITYPGQFKYQMSDESTFVADYYAAAILLSERTQTLAHDGIKDKETAIRKFKETKEEWKQGLSGLARTLANIK